MINNDTKIGLIVAEDSRTAAVFDSYGIDFCCGGDRTLEEVCEARNLGLELVIEAINQVKDTNTDVPHDFNSWDLGLLADYIEKVHHKFVKESIPNLLALLDKICKVHGDNHKELLKIKDLFTASATELLSHMAMEENIIFPFIKQLIQNKAPKDKLQQPFFGNIQHPINRMLEEHTIEGARFEEIKQLAANYTPPEDACITFDSTYNLLHQFEDDLHLHIHLENNILFPKAIKLEKELQDEPY